MLVILRLMSKIIHKLRKLANMGSGICFPLLALNVYATAVTALRIEHRYSLKDAMASVYVYGDDLIVPSQTVSSVKSWLCSVGYLVNEGKSFVQGYFRESCGADYYHGVKVSPVRFRLPGAGLAPTSDYRNGFVPIGNEAGLIQVDAHCRELKDSYLDTLAEYYYRLLERPLGTLPMVGRDSVFIGRYDPGSIIIGTNRKSYYPVTATTVFTDACPLKGLGRSLNSVDGLMQDWSLTPVRRQLSLKRRVPELGELVCWGLPQHPRDILKREGFERNLEELLDLGVIKNLSPARTDVLHCSRLIDPTMHFMRSLARVVYPDLDFDEQPYRLSQKDIERREERRRKGT